MRMLSYCYRFVLNFLLLAIVYFSLNALERYEQRTIVAALVSAYTAMRIVSGLRSLYFFKCIEHLEFEMKRLAKFAENLAQKHIVRDVAALRSVREVASYIDLLFLATIFLVCVIRIVHG